MPFQTSNFPAFELVTSGKSTKTDCNVTLMIKANEFSCQNTYHSTNVLSRVCSCILEDSFRLKVPYFAATYICKRTMTS